MEPLSIAAGLIGLMGSLVKLNEVRGDIFEAKNEIESLFREVDGLMNVLTHLQNLKHMPESLSENLLLAALKDCNVTAEKADFLLLRSSISRVPGLYWAYTGKKEVLQLCRELCAQKTTIGLLLNSGSLHASREVGEKFDQFLAGIKDSGHLPENGFALQRFQSYAESETGQSSITYVDEETRKHPTVAEWDEFLLPMHSNGNGVSNDTLNYEVPSRESTNVRLASRRISSDYYKFQSKLSGHSSGVSSVTFSRDGRQLLSGSWDGSLRLWDVEMEYISQSIEGHTDEATSVLFVGDETILASSSSDATIRFWDASSGALLQRLDDHTEGISGLAYARYTGALASGSGDGTVRIWNIESGSAVRILNGNHGGIWSLAMSADGRQVVSGSGDGTISIWDTRTKSAARKLEGHTNGVRSLAISGDRLASGSWDRTVMLWDTRTGSATQTLQSHDDHITSVVYVGQKWLASGSGDDSAFKLWDTETGLLVQKLHTDGGTISCLAFSASNGGQLASGSGDRTIGLWNEVSRSG